jgi:hypothetical protein
MGFPPLHSEIFHFHPSRQHLSLPPLPFSSRGLLQARRAEAPSPARRGFHGRAFLPSSSPSSLPRLAFFFSPRRSAPSRPLLHFCFFPSLCSLSVAGHGRTGPQLEQAPGTSCKPDLQLPSARTPSSLRRVPSPADPSPSSAMAELPVCPLPALKIQRGPISRPAPLLSPPHGVELLRRTSVTCPARPPSIPVHDARLHLPLPRRLSSLPVQRAPLQIFASTPNSPPQVQPCPSFIFFLLWPSPSRAWWLASLLLARSLVVQLQVAAARRTRHLFDAMPSQVAVRRQPPVGSATPTDSHNKPFVAGAPPCHATVPVVLLRLRFDLPRLTARSSSRHMCSNHD